MQAVSERGNLFVKLEIMELLSGIKCMEYLIEKISRQKVFTNMQILGKNASLESAKAFRKELERMISVNLKTEYQEKKADKIYLFRIIEMETKTVLFVGKSSAEQIPDYAESCICQCAEVREEEADCLMQILIWFYQPASHHGRKWSEKDWDFLHIESAEDGMKQFCSSLVWENYCMPEENWKLLLEQAPDETANASEKRNYLKKLERCINAELRLKFYGGYESIISETEKRYWKGGKS